MLDKAGKHVEWLDRNRPNFVITLSGDAAENKAIHSYWRGRALGGEGKWSEAKVYLIESARGMNDATTYAQLASVQEQQREWTKAKDSYLEAAVRESAHRQENVGKFVALSLKTGTPNSGAALQELAGAQKRDFDAKHYEPQLVDLPMPDISLKSEDRASITAASLRGKIIVLDLWATWCGPCVAELSGFDKFRQLHPEIVVLPVAEQSSLADVKKVFRAQKLKFDPIVAADDQNTARFGANGVPQTYAIDGNGRIRIVHYGGLPDVVSYLGADLAALVASQANQ